MIDSNTDLDIGYDTSELKNLHDRFESAKSKGEIGQLAVLAIEHLPRLIDRFIMAEHAIEQMELMHQPDLMRRKGHAVWIEFDEDLPGTLLKTHGEIVQLEAARRLPDEWWAQIGEDLESFASRADAAAAIARHDTRKST